MRAKVAALLCLLTLVAAACLPSGVIDRAFSVATAPRIPALPAGASPRAREMAASVFEKMQQQPELAAISVERAADAAD